MELVIRDANGTIVKRIGYGQPIPVLKRGETAALRFR
jgi:hypothetical protein